MADSNSSDKDLHLQYLSKALQISESSPPKPTNFRVGALLVSFPLPPDSNSPSPPPVILSTGYTLELPGNTHAEQCAFSKLASSHSISEFELSTILTPQSNVTLYTTLEPCGKRLSGNISCVQRIIATRKGSTEGAQNVVNAGGVRKVVFGAKEPGTFVKNSASCQMLDDAGVEWEYVADIEKDILKVAMKGHMNKGEAREEGQGGTNVDDISADERERQEALPRNPKSV